MNTLPTDRRSREQDAERVLREGVRPVLRYLRAMVDTPAQAEDLAQETLVRAFTALARGERPERPQAWLLGIARHVLLETWRGERARRRVRRRQELETPGRGRGRKGLEGMEGDGRRGLPAPVSAGRGRPCTVARSCR